MAALSAYPNGLLDSTKDAVPCIIEHPQLMALRREGVPVLGINYKDRAPDAQAFLFWSRMPLAELHNDHIILSDQRFTDPRVASRFQLTLRAPK